MSALETALLAIGILAATVAALPGVGFDRLWYRAFGRGELSTVAAGAFKFALLFVLTIGVLALVGEVAG